MAQVEFFSTSKDEEKLFSYISKNTDILFSVVNEGFLAEFEPLSELKIPDFDSSFEVYFWNKSVGKIKWLREKPKIDFSKNSKLVKSVFTQENWIKEKKKRDFQKMIDSENSPILYYQRGQKIEGLVLPSLLLSTQSSLDVFGEDFKKWFNRTSSWIKRNSELVHDWRKQNTQIRNDWEILNNIYAMKGSLLNLDKYAISIDDRT